MNRHNIRYNEKKCKCLTFYTKIKFEGDWITRVGRISNPLFIHSESAGLISYILNSLHANVRRLSGHGFFWPKQLLTRISLPHNYIDRKLCTFVT